MTAQALLSPAAVLDQVAKALPEDLRAHVIIIGSLAAGYCFFAGDGAAAIRTKDVDCLFTPHAKAVAAAVQVTEQLLEANWMPRKGAKWSEPGRPDQALEDLPMVRLTPPGTDGNPSQWFIELLSAPPSHQAGSQAKQLQRVSTAKGDFALCSFGYLALAECEPLITASRVRVARPEMMALANLLHHPVIGADLIDGTDYKRSNKDLGRVLALAHLTIMRDRREDTDELGQWSARMWQALNEKFSDEARALALRAGHGIRALIASQQDFAQALDIANRGLLATLDLGVDAMMATARRVEAEVLDPLAESAG